MANVAIKLTGNAHNIRKAKQDLKHIRNRWLDFDTTSITFWRDKHDLWRKICRDFKLDWKIVPWDK